MRYQQAVLKIWEPITQWREAISQKNGYLNDTAAETWKLECMRLFDECNQNKNVSKNYAKLSVSSKCLQGISSCASKQKDRQVTFLLLFVANVPKIKSQETSCYFELCVNRVQF